MITDYKNTPNISNYKIKPLGIILHHSGGNYIGGVSWILNPSSKVSYHCLVDINGNKTIFAKDNQRCWHSGSSSFKGKKDCNTFMLGISVTGDTYKRVLTKEEVNVVSDWCIEKMETHNITLDWITTHRKVSPSRKTDISPAAEKQIIDAIKEKTQK
jgi:N-acetyl-anhydromuramyl-L-alanine amidase AmpD